jgi:flagellar basal-body rod protein FlgG
MAITALHSAATGLSALSTQLDVLANNLANINTVGFKASRVNFEDLFYQHKVQPGAENANGDQRPSGIAVGLGTRVSSTQLDFRQGDLVPSNSDYSIAIQGRGFFEVKILDDIGGGRGFTRAGNFTKNMDGDIVLNTADGPRLEPPINVPTGTTKVEISQTGLVIAFIDNAEEPTEIGQIQLANFVNPGGLMAQGGNIFTASSASGPPIVGDPGQSQFGTVINRQLEGSNVSPVHELVQLIKTQRAFEMNSQTIQAADQALQVIGNLRRF